MTRLALMVGIAFPLALADLYVKATHATAPWAYHQRSGAWLVMSATVLVGAAVVSLIPAAFAAPAAGVLAAGVIGNSVSAVANGMAVPNPLVLDSSRAMIAFNLADIWAITGIVLLFSTLAAWLIRHRDRLPGNRMLDKTSTIPRRDGL